MLAAFSQTVSCSHGVKPYRDATTSGPWSVSFDGDELSLVHATNRRYGGRFSTSGNPIIRENYPGAALLETYLGASGGSIWFVKALDGRITSTGHNVIGGGGTCGPVLECGDSERTDWVDTPTTTPLIISQGTATTLRWTTGSISMSCRDSSIAPNSFSATLITRQDGSASVVRNESNTLLAEFDIRDPGAKEDSALGRFACGLSWSLSDITASPPAWSVSIDTGFDAREFKLLSYIDNRAGVNRTMNCVAAGLEPN